MSGDLLWANDDASPDATYEAPRAYCPVCRAEIPWPEPIARHRSAHRAERYSALAAEDAAHAEVVRAIDRDRDMHRNRE